MNTLHHLSDKYQWDTRDHWCRSRGRRGQGQFSGLSFCPYNNNSGSSPFVSHLDDTPGSELTSLPPPLLTHLPWLPLLLTCNGRGASWPAPFLPHRPPGMVWQPAIISLLCPCSSHTGPLSPFSALHLWSGPLQPCPSGPLNLLCPLPRMPFSQHSDQVVPYRPSGCRQAGQVPPTDRSFSTVFIILLLN